MSINGPEKKNKLWGFALFSNFCNYKETWNTAIVADSPFLLGPIVQEAVCEQREPPHAKTSIS